MRLVSVTFARVCFVMSFVHCCRAFQSGFAVRDSLSGEFSWVSGSVASSPPSGALAYGDFADTIASEGFGSLSVSTLREVDDDAWLFESLGFAEGYLTAERTVQHMFNMLDPVAPEIEDFMLQHNEYLRRQADMYAGSDPYWRIVDFLLVKQRGFVSGMRARLSGVRPESLTATFTSGSLATEEVRLLGLSDAALQAELLRLNLLVDLSEITRAIKYSKGGKISEEAARIAREAIMAEGKTGHCSALIKVAGRRVLLGHTTWDTFGSLMRMWKDYSFPHVKMPSLVSRHISMSSYPGFFASNDDWLQMRDTQMVALETTLDAYDTERLAKYISPACVSTMMRSMIASMLASHPREWYEIFSRQNSGSQNNQWMIFSSRAWAAAVDSGFQRHQARDILWVLEQQPGLIIGRDMTDTLLETGYWGSWNVARFNETLTVSQYESHRGLQCICEGQRGALLDELQGHIETLADLQIAMRTNTWRSSPLSWACPKCAVVARFDLPGANTSNHCFKPAFYGSIDAKVSDDRMIIAGESMFVAAPSDIGVPAFSWETAPITTPNVRMPRHVGHAEGPMNFTYQLVGGNKDFPMRDERSELITLFT
eukprot:TRINITY_DN69629_c0_g1_i1.p1 TRINITY_DN69629_c0_g1~~TRINITY_DN69629_c0_g1_i1.p1  ORF type:complete len:598 (-),score=64.16 TRINITY_DN69629_c0_g1_i1:27-1820(-)